MPPPKLNALKGHRVVLKQTPDEDGLNKRVLVGVVAVIAALLFLILLLFLLPLLLGGGGTSNEGGGGGLGTAAAGGGRSDSGEEGYGESDVAEVVDEGGSDAVDDSTEPEGADSGEEGGTSQMRREGQRRPRSDRGFSGFSIASIPEPQENRSRMASSSAGFDDVADRLRDAGAKSGDVQVSLAWNNFNDLDLHVISPSGERIYFQHRRAGDGGELDVDMNAGSHRSDKPVENVFWAEGQAPEGEYSVQVHHYANRGSPDPTRFQIVIKVNGRRRKFEGTIRYGDPIRTIHQFRK